MIRIICGTNRPGATSRKMSAIIEQIYQHQNQPVEVIDLAEMPLNELTGDEYWKPKPAALQRMVDQVMTADGLHLVTPEYNGAMPGVLKLFIDHMKFPQSFQNRPVCFVGLGGMWGGLRPVEHLQQIFSCREAFQFPQRVFFPKVNDSLQHDALPAELHQRLETQVKGFIAFVNVLKQAELDANSRLKQQSS